MGSRLENLIGRINHCQVCEDTPQKIIKGRIKRTLGLKPQLGNVMDAAGIISPRVCREDHTGFAGHTSVEIREAARRDGR